MNLGDLEYWQSPVSVSRPAVSVYQRIWTTVTGVESQLPSNLKTADPKERMVVRKDRATRDTFVTPLRIPEFSR